MRTMFFDNVYLGDSFTMIGSVDKNPIVKTDVKRDDYYMGKRSVEEAEVSYQGVVINGLLKKLKKLPNNIDLMVGSDLQNQLFASNFNASNYSIPFLGVYSACASFIEGLIIGSGFIENELINNAIVVVSSHNLVNEKQFRFPIEYGALRKKVNAFSSTGSACVYISKEKSGCKIESAIIGKVIDIGWTDTNDMGASMAPAVAETLYEHLKSTDRNPDYYDLIITGDLGIYGLKYMKKYIKKKYNLNIDNVVDAGMELFKVTEKDNYAGGSGPLCLPVIFLDYLKQNKYKNILLVGSGSLHSSVSSNLKKSMPSIGHAISVRIL